jgi:phosphoenolpyruvate carboxylase
MTPDPRSEIGTSHRLDQRLLDDIRFLGQLLGDTIREQEGEATFERIETIRRLSIAFERDADPEVGRKLDTLLHALTTDEAMSVLRAFTYFSHLANIAEDRCRDPLWRGKLRSATVGARGQFEERARPIRIIAEA